MRPKTNENDESTDERHRRKLLSRDDRAIEGLPIRLVIALVVGVASLAIMMSMLGGIGEFGETEVYVEYPEGNILDVEDVSGGPGNEVQLDTQIYSDDGEPVEGSTVVVTSGSAQLDETIVREADSDSHVATLEIKDVSLRSDQNKGTLTVEVIPPSDSSYVDERANQEIVILRNYND